MPRRNEVKSAQNEGTKISIPHLIAELLGQAVEEVPIRNMAGRLGIARGTLQALQKEASVFCGMVVCFCRHLQWHELANVLFSFQVLRRAGMAGWGVRVAGC